MMARSSSCSRISFLNQRLCIAFALVSFSICSLLLQSSLLRFSKVKYELESENLDLETFIYPYDTTPEQLDHLSYLHAACMRSEYKDSIISWEYGSQAQKLDDTYTIEKSNPNLMKYLEACPDVDIYLPVGLRSPGYCEDAVGYVIFLKSRLLPAWVFEIDIPDGKGNLVKYYDLCPKTPVIFFNHYDDGIPRTENGWPTTKPIYLMPNIEMFALNQEHYWRADVVLCKTVICANRARKWYRQEGNPRNTQVFYTRHSTSDIGGHTRRHQATRIKQKDFDNVNFIHVTGTSSFKGTSQVLECWMSRKDLPKLHVYIAEDHYKWRFKKYDNKTLEDHNVQVTVGHVVEDEFGRIMAEAAFMICPSTREGYGHYLNQARAAEALIVTTNVPPMNELITPTRGVLIPAGRKFDKEGVQLLGGHYDGIHGLRGVEGLNADFTGKEVCDAIDFIIKELDPKQREALGKRAREAYLDDLHFFEKKMKQLKEFVRKRALEWK